MKAGLGKIPQAWEVERGNSPRGRVYLTFLQVKVVALRELHPRSAHATDPPGPTGAPLPAALLVAARRYVFSLRPDRAQSARGLAQSKSWRPLPRARRSRSVLDCASPLALWDGAAWQSAKQVSATSSPSHPSWAVLQVKRPLSTG